MHYSYFHLIFYCTFYYTFRFLFFVQTESLKRRVFNSICQNSFYESLTFKFIRKKKFLSDLFLCNYIFFPFLWILKYIFYFSGTLNTNNLVLQWEEDHAVDTNTFILPEFAITQMATEDTVACYEDKFPTPRMRIGIHCHNVSSESKIANFRQTFGP